MRSLPGKYPHVLRPFVLSLCLLLLTVSFLTMGSSCSLIQWDILEGNWKLDAIDTMRTQADPPWACRIPAATDTTEALRDECLYDKGAHATETLGVPPTFAAESPIRHVIVVMKENRSYDELLGKIRDEGQPDSEAVPSTFENRDMENRVVHPFPARSTCFDADPDHQWDAMHAGVANGAMSGFVTSAENSTDTNGHFVMGYYDDEKLPFYYWLANTFALSDRHFAPTRTGTYANRNFMLFGFSAGVVDSGLSFPDPKTPSIFRELMDVGDTWAVYTDGLPFSGALDWDSSEPGVHPFKNLLQALDDGTLPNVAFVDGIDDVEDDHPPADIQVGEAWMRRIYEHAVRSPEWSRLAIIWTYDESGGFADHVPPPNGCVATPSDVAFYERGARVPLVAISPWAKQHYVSHVAHDHTAITRFIETLFDLPALTARDANSDALMDLFDFSCDSNMSAPPDAPLAGTGACSQ